MCSFCVTLTISCVRADVNFYFVGRKYNSCAVSFFLLLSSSTLRSAWSFCVSLVLVSNARKIKRLVILLSSITYQCQAPGEGGSGNPQAFDCDVYPQGGDTRSDIMHLIIFFPPGVRILIIFLVKVKILTLCAWPLSPPQIGLDIDRCITCRIVFACT